MQDYIAAFLVALFLAVSFPIALVGPFVLALGYVFGYDALSVLIIPYLVISSGLFGYFFHKNLTFI